MAIISFAMNLCAPELPEKIKWILIGLLAMKMIGSVAYFEHFFIIRESGNVTITAYGDSFLHHRAAVEFLESWAKNGTDLGLNPDNQASYEPSLVTSLGYSGLLALIYFVAGIVPEVGIVVNAFLSFIFCLLSYKLFIIAGLSTRTALVGLVILFFCPGLWLWSALLYKDSLLFTIVAACTLAAIKLIDKYSWRSLLLVIVLLVLLLTLRFSFVIPLLALLLFGSFYLSQTTFKKSLFVSLAGGGVLIALLIIQVNFNLMNTTVSIMDTVKTVIDLKPAGGNFMTNGIGSISPNISNFWYTLPARAVYILMIPMPWFGGNSGVERFDYIVSHLDAVYDITLFMALLITLFQRKYIESIKIQNTLLVIGLMYFIIPLFFFSPGRRYMTIAMPFLLVYTLPFLIQKKNAITSLIMAAIFISIVQITYYAIYS
ncbi:MAG: hypothetical protein KKD92_16100 [Proteobacteria bacterium]|nr:hypothetical protein [Pseudomonadota bacterium]